MDANRKAFREEMRAIFGADWKDTMSCQVTTEARLDSKELNSEDMESGVELRQILTEEDAVKTCGTIKKRHRGRKQAAGRREEPKELTRGDCGLRRKLAAACRKVSCSATVAWRKGNFFRELWTAKGMGRSRQEDVPKYKSGTVQGTRSQEIRPAQCGTRNPERMDVREVRS
jgi:hypothetical protein